ncbi:hypothetical protein SERLA73DRAFT_126659 [Serpula lacrymans var. lacrymans S7.3]|uniref:Uncharacterized protein n=1 Tax=Serpula lacrymans var. lacrymans (strain S7.3) TaxID=936435 RepID=F8QE91_SERL3|nr:hypothetical protein SERLA73DRAFT_126659 [Serpula lacrymans var. lacrymans S7.3]
MALFVRVLFARIPPNVTALSDALNCFLRERGYQLSAKGSLQRQFGNALHWYTVLTFSEDEASKYLYQCCPLCFGTRLTPSEEFPNCMVCLDTCFTQKPRCREGRQAERTCKEDCPGPSTIDGYKQGMAIPKLVLDGCADSFLAADEKREKASTNFLADTGLMALLCRHNCVLWLVSMTSAGEKQRYALALLKKLLNNLPRPRKIGVLYDIALLAMRFPPNLSPAKAFSNSMWMMIFGKTPA